MTGRDNPKLRTRSKIYDLLAGAKQRIPLLRTEELDANTVVIGGHVFRLDDDVIIQRGEEFFDFPGAPADDSWGTRVIEESTITFDPDFIEQPVMCLPGSTRPGTVIQRGEADENEVTLRYLVYGSSVNSGTSVKWMAIGKT